MPSAVPPWASCTFDLPARPRAAVPVTCPQAELNQPAGLLPCTRTQALRAPSRLPCCAATQVPKRLCSQSGVGSALHLPKATPSPRAKLPCYCCAHQRVTPTRPPPNLRKNISKRKNKGRTKGDSGMNQIKSPQGTRREGPPFLINSWNKISQIHLKSLTLEKKRGEERK